MLPEFMAQHPELDLEVILDDRQIDLGLRALRRALEGHVSGNTFTPTFNDGYIFSMGSTASK